MNMGKKSVTGKVFLNTLYVRGGNERDQVQLCVCNTSL
jgi:hypothetical protein